MRHSLTCLAYCPQTTVSPGPRSPAARSDRTLAAGAKDPGSPSRLPHASMRGARPVSPPDDSPANPTPATTPGVGACLRTVCRPPL